MRKVYGIFGCFCRQRAEAFHRAHSKLSPFAVRTISTTSNASQAPSGIFLLVFPHSMRDISYNLCWTIL
jgi:hypothetical protein